MNYNNQVNYNNCSESPLEWIIIIKTKDCKSTGQSKSEVIQRITEKFRFEGTPGSPVIHPCVGFAHMSRDDFNFRSGSSEPCQ